MKKVIVRSAVIVLAVLLFVGYVSAQDLPDAGSAEVEVMPRMQLPITTTQLPLTVDGTIRHVDLVPPDIVQVRWTENGRSIIISPVAPGDMDITISFKTNRPKQYPVSVLPAATHIQTLIESETCLPTPTARTEVKGTHLFVMGLFQSVYEFDEVQDFLDRNSGHNYKRATVLQAGLTEDATTDLARLILKGIQERANHEVAGIVPKSTSAEWGRQLILFCRNLDASEQNSVQTVVNRFRSDHHAPVEIVTLTNKDESGVEKPPTMEQLRQAAQFLQGVINMRTVSISARKSGFVWAEGEVFADDEVDAIATQVEQACGKWCTVRLTVNPEEVRHELEVSLGETGFGDVQVSIARGKMYLQGSVADKSNLEKVKRLAKQFVYRSKYLRYQIGVSE